MGGANLQLSRLIGDLDLLDSGGFAEDLSFCYSRICVGPSLFDASVGFIETDGYIFLHCKMVLLD